MQYIIEISSGGAFCVELWLNYCKIRISVPMSYIVYLEITLNRFSSPWNICCRNVVAGFVARIATGATKPTTTLRQQYFRGEENMFSVISKNTIYDIGTEILILPLSSHNSTQKAPLSEPRIQIYTKFCVDYDSAVKT